MLKFSPISAPKVTIHVSYQYGKLVVKDLIIAAFEASDFGAAEKSRALELIRDRKLKQSGIKEAWVTDDSGKTIACLMRGSFPNHLDGAYWLRVH